MGIEVLAAASLGGSLIGAGVSAMGASNAASANAASANYQAAVARNNQILAGRYADLSINRGNLQSELADYKTRQATGTARAGLAASGVDINSGSAKDVRTSVAEMGELDSRIIRDKAAEEAFGYKVKGMDFAAEARLDEMKAENYLTAGKYGVATSILGGATSVSDKWIGYQTKGVFS
jgi:hypothetical protein